MLELIAGDHLLLVDVAVSEVLHRLGPSIQQVIYFNPYQILTKVSGESDDMMALSWFEQLIIIELLEVGILCSMVGDLRGEIDGLRDILPVVVRDSFEITRPITKQINY